MTNRLSAAIEAAKALTEEQQNHVAETIFSEIADAAWDRDLHESQECVAALADEALLEHRAGRTRALNIAKL